MGEFGDAQCGQGGMEEVNSPPPLYADILYG